MMGFKLTLFFDNEVIPQKFCVAKLWIKIVSYEKYFYELRVIFLQQYLSKILNEIHL